MNPWFVYILRCVDDTLYTGISIDVARRVDQHNAGNPPGARYTSGRRPVVLVYAEAAADRSAAQRRERAIKALDRAGKLALIASAQAIDSFDLVIPAHAGIQLNQPD